MSSFKVIGENGTTYVIHNKHDEKPAQNEKNGPTFHASEGDWIMVDGDGNGRIDTLDPYHNYEISADSSSMLANLHLSSLEGIKLKGLSDYLSAMRACNKSPALETSNDATESLGRLEVLLTATNDIGLEPSEIRADPRILEAGDIIDRTIFNIIDTLATAIDHKSIDAQTLSSSLTRLIQLAQNAQVDEMTCEEINRLNTRGSDREFDGLILSAIGLTGKPTLESLKYLAKAKEIAPETSNPQQSEKIIETILSSIEVSFDDALVIKGTDSDAGEASVIQDAVTRLEAQFPSRNNDAAYQRVFNIYNRRRARDLASVYERFLHASVSGEVTLSFTVTPEGEVLHAETSSKNIQDPRFLAELREYASHMRFPPRPDATENFVVNYPINFIPQSQYKTEVNAALSSSLTLTHQYLFNRTSTNEVKTNPVILTDADGHVLWCYVNPNSGDANFNDNLRALLMGKKFPPTPDHAYGVIRAKVNYQREPAILDIARISS